MRRFPALIAGVSIPVMLLGLVPAEAAFEHSVVVSADPVDWTPHVENGRVRSLATVDGITVAVGNFTTVREQGAPSTIARSRIFAFDSTGKVSSTFVPVVTGSEMRDVIDAGDGTSVYVAGSFSRVNGQPRTARVVRLDVHTGQVVSSFKAPSFNKPTQSLHLANGRLYVTGDFTRVGGQARTSLVALDPQTGADTGHANLTFAGTWNGGVVGIEDFTMSPDGSRLVAIGNFRTVNGQSRPQIAMVNTSGATATLDPWATTRYSTNCSRSFDTYMYDVDSSPDGSYFVVVTTGAYSGGPSTGTLCDAVARWEYGPTGSSQQPTWIMYSGGDTFTAVEVTGPAIYVGGHFRWVNNPYASDRRGPGALSRKGLAALDPRNGLPLSWNPGRQRGWGVWGFRSDAQGLWIGHDTSIVGQETHKRIALMPLEGGQSLPPENTGALPGNVFLPGQGSSPADEDRLVRNMFSGSAVTDSAEVNNGGIDWSSARGTFMVDGRLYTGWANGTLTRHTYNGNQFGPGRAVDLYSLTAFASELQSMRGMFYDKADGRLYFTLNGSSKLYYRYFTPEHHVVGGIRYEASTGGVDWRSVTGGFIAGGKLYYRTDNGQLNAMTWQRGPVTGTTSTVSGPTIDGVDWNSRAMFLQAG